MPSAAFGPALRSRPQGSRHDPSEAFRPKVSAHGSPLSGPGRAVMRTTIRSTTSTSSSGIPRLGAGEHAGGFDATGLDRPEVAGRLRPPHLRPPYGPSPGPRRRPVYTPRSAATGLIVAPGLDRYNATTSASNSAGVTLHPHGDPVLLGHQDPNLSGVQTRARAPSLNPKHPVKIRGNREWAR